jgi:hypothetical protein
MRYPASSSLHGFDETPLEVFRVLRCIVLHEYASANLSMHIKGYSGKEKNRVNPSVNIVKAPRMVYYK